MLDRINCCIIDLCSGKHNLAGGGEEHEDEAIDRKTHRVDECSGL